MSCGPGCRQRYILAMLAAVERQCPGGWVDYRDLTAGQTRSAVNTARRATRGLIDRNLVEIDEYLMTSNWCDMAPGRGRLVNRERGADAADSNRTVRIRWRTDDAE